VSVQPFWRGNVHLVQSHLVSTVNAESAVVVRQIAPCRLDDAALAAAGLPIPEKFAAAIV